MNLPHSLRSSAFTLLIIGFTSPTFAFPNMWGSLAYLQWGVQNSPIDIPLATQNPDPASFAIIGEPGTKIIFGAGSHSNDFNFHRFNGARITFGAWLDPCNRFGLEASSYSFAQEKTTFTASSLSNTSTVNVPFISALTGNENVLVAAGIPNVITDTDSFRPYSIEVNGLYNFPNLGRVPLILTAGFRYVNLYEKLILNDAVYNIPTLAANSVLNVQDNFITKNKFFGVQLGLKTKITYCNFFLAGSTAVAFGRNNQKLEISGQTDIQQRLIQNIGLFAEPTNIGAFKHNQYAVSPEIQIKLGYNESQHIRPFITYEGTYINNVIKAGKTIDRNINTSQNQLLGGSGIVVGPRAPMPKWQSSSIWLQGFSMGIEFGLDE